MSSLPPQDKERETGLPFDDGAGNTPADTGIDGALSPDEIFYRLSHPPMPTDEELAAVHPAVARSWRVRFIPNPPPEWDGYCRRDMGPEVLKFLYDFLAIEEEWSVQEQRGFCWWPDRLRQVIRALPPVRQERFLLTRILICSDFLRDVPDTPQTLEVLDKLNHTTVMHSYVWDRTRKRIKLLSVGVVHEGNAGWVSVVLSAAMAIQAEMAGKLATSIAEMIGAAPDCTHHPSRGPRPEPHPCLEFIKKCYLPFGLLPSRFGQKWLERAAMMFRSQGLLANAGEAGLTAEFPFYGSKSAMQSLFEELLGVADCSPLQTSLFQCWPHIAHPVLGNGMVAILRLPCSISESLEPRRRFVTHLNRAWRHRLLIAPRLGAWCLPPSYPIPSYVMFVPNYLGREGIIEWVGQQFAVISKLALQELFRFAAVDPME